jgi:hypothetical protein
MLWKLTLTLCLSVIAFGPQAPQLKTRGERQNDSLPSELTEAETQNILREKSPRPHIDAALKVSDARLDSALKLAEASQFQSAAEEVDVYAALVIYADSYTRKLPESQSKDRNVCLKKIEQTVFRQTRTIEAAMRQLPIDYREKEEPRIDKVKQVRLRAINDLLGGGKIIKSSEEP